MCIYVSLVEGVCGRGANRGGEGREKENGGESESRSGERKGIGANPNHRKREERGGGL